MICALAAAAAGVAVFAYSPSVRNGVRDGVDLCVSSVIPSLFIFTVLAVFVFSSGLAALAGRLVEPVFKRLFGLSGEQSAVMLLSFVSGYPVGARLIASMYDRGGISLFKGRLMLLYCVNAGPAFIVTAVGAAVLGSASDGVRLLISHLSASTVMAAALGFIIKRKEGTDVRLVRAEKSAGDKVCLSDVFVSSVSDASVTMLSICAFVVLFSGIGGMVEALPVSKAAIRTVRGLLEVTVGLQDCTRGELGRAAFLLGFGGISVLFQVTSAARSLRPSAALLLLSRVIHGTLSWVIVSIAERAFPRSLETVSAGAPVLGGALHTSPPAAAALILLSVVLIIYTKTAFLSRGGGNRRKNRCKTSENDI